MQRAIDVSSFLMLALAASTSIAAQQPDTTRKHSGLAGVVRDSPGRPIIAAKVLVDGSTLIRSR